MVQQVRDTAQGREEPVGLILQTSPWFPENSVFSRRRHTTNNWAVTLHKQKRGKTIPTPKRSFFFPINCFKPPEWNHYSKLWMMQELKSSCPGSWERISHSALFTCIVYVLCCLMEYLAKSGAQKPGSFFMDGEWAFLSTGSAKAKSVLQSMGGVQNLNF